MMAEKKGRTRKPTAPSADAASGGRDIGIDVPMPAKACTDVKCPFHGRLPVRGQILESIEVKKYRGVRNRLASAGIADLLVVAVKKGTPETRKQVMNAVVVRQRRPFRRPEGMMVQFEDNACVIVTPEGEVKGSDIKGPVAREAAERWPRVAATASMIV